jgi:hypothetical protein
MAINRDVMMIDGGGDFEPTPTIAPVPAVVSSVPVSSVASFRKAEDDGVSIPCFSVADSILGSTLPKEEFMLCSEGSVFTINAI